MKILILANNDVGLYKFRKELIERLLDANNNVLISLPKGDFIEPLKSLGCRYIQTDFQRRSKNPLADIQLFMIYRSIIKKEKPEIVLTYTIKPNVYGGMACIEAGIPYISNITGLGSAMENPGFVRKLTIDLYKIGLRKAHRVFFQNKSNLDFFNAYGIAKKNAALIPGSGVNLNYYYPGEYPSEEGGVSFLFIGRIMKDKGIVELLSAIKAVKAMKPNTQFHLIGGCDEDYQEELADSERKGLIVYYGHQPQVKSFILNSHCTVLPSYHEGIANVLLESAASGRPVIATDVPGCRETFDDKITGLSCKPRDANSLVDAMLRFIRLPWAQKKEMGLNGRKKMEREFDRNIVIEAYMQEIETIYYQGVSDVVV